MFPHHEISLSRAAFPSVGMRYFRAIKNKEGLSKQKSPEVNVRKIRVNNVTFEITPAGLVSTRECGALGHVEECTRRGEALLELVDILVKIEASLSDDKSDPENIA